MAALMNTATALEFPVPSRGNVVGDVEITQVKPGQTLLDVARENDIGVQEILTANPKFPKKPKPGTKVVVPAQFKLPSEPWVGIVINLAHMRLYYFHEDGRTVTTHPLGVGRQGWSTPQGKTTIVAKEANPAWHPPASIRREAEARGKTLPLVVPAGPNNPLGQYAMRLGFSGILLHGTNQPSSIGLRSSHGCMRMYPEDIKNLFHLTPVGTPVRIVFEPL